MKTSTQTTISLVLKTESATAYQQDFEVMIEHGTNDDSTPYKITLGCQEIWLFDLDLKKVVRALNAAMRIRKNAVQ